METLFASQDSLLHRMSRTCENLKKKGRANQTKNLLQTVLANLDDRWHQFQRQDETILATASAEERKCDYFTLDLFTQGEDVYCEQRGQLLDILESISPPPSNPLDASLTVTGHRGRSALPRIDLPTFSGAYPDWTRFRDLFTSLVINDTAWSDAEKSHYLAASLSGEAAQLIQRIPVGSDNFAKAWELLENRYENRRLLVDAQFDILYSLKPCQTHSAKELRRLLDTTCNVAAVLTSLKVAVDDRSYWMVQHLVRRLDERTLMDWETFLGNETAPAKYSTLTDFLETTIRTLDAFEQRHGQPQMFKRPANRPAKTSHVTSKSTSPSRNTKKRSCTLCAGAHILCFCEAFRGKTPPERLAFVNSRQLCRNCLSRHPTADCPSQKSCQRCGERHHTTIHEALKQNRQPSAATLLTSTDSPVEAPVSVLLATAVVSVVTEGRTILTRALIDPCSEVSLVSESLVQQLRLPRIACSQILVGAGAKETATAKGKVNLLLSSRQPSQYTCAVSPLILPRLTSYRPRCKIFSATWPHIQGLSLADPSFHSSTPIDLLLGADVYPHILLDGIQRGSAQTPIAQATIFGWILSGPTSGPEHPVHTVSSHTCSTYDLCSLVRRFWEQEEISPPHSQLTPEERACEELFATTHSRDNKGRYQVRLPFKGPIPDLGETHKIARRILFSNERRLHNQADLKASYIKFMAEYLSLGHMQPVPDEDSTPQRPHFYLPHHGVFKNNGASAKIRVVFNGSRSSSTGVSLNSHLAAGPKLQRDLLDILLRWRRHRVAFMADIEKMYRQIRVHPDDWDFQRILWRDNPENKISIFHLTTVTYGLTCAPYLALRTLLQLADDEEATFPKGAAILRSSTYVDDILSGSDSITEALNVQNELRSICAAGGFILKKWSANRPELLSDLPTDFLADTCTAIPWSSDAECGALGLLWHPATDTLSFSIHAPQDPVSIPLTKRTVLSHIAKLFDPLGWLAPFVVRGKIFLQELWKLGLDWDDNLPSTVSDKWVDLLHEMPTLASVRIPRWLGLDHSTISRQLHVFVDASEKAFAAVTYLRVEHCSGKVTSHLLVAKTKAAPLKTISLPRLELCAATLGARLLVQLQRELHLPIAALHLWSDSTIALAWLHGEPSRWQTYVANRVSEVQTIVPDVRLHHVGSRENPADCASRGISAPMLVDHPLWWSGPSWLTASPSQWDVTADCVTKEEERSPAKYCHVNLVLDPPLILRFSTLHRLVRVTAWCLRWRERRRSTGPKGLPLQPDELRRAEELWIRLTQQHTFASEISCIIKQNPLPRSSRLAPMLPFLDDNHILRVGGRITHSLLSYDEQHPVILPPDAHLTRLVIEQMHLRTLHGGAQLTLASVRQRYWIPQGRRQVKSCISQCYRCIRWRTTSRTQVMGNLPARRVTPSRPFLHTGLDYAGPFTIKATAGRGSKTVKGYVAIFICFSTRAVHIEVVTDYSAMAFLAAFRRFTGRRGLCSTLTSDCGTNFVGADRELRRMFAASSQEAATIGVQLAKDGVRWRFNPPGAPHFGGLWEAAVRSTKHHLRRTIGDSPLTYEELSTILCQVEACLNSRPLHALTDDPDDLAPLTPGHFLIGGPLTAVPEATLLDTPVNRLSRWQLVQQQVQHFWHRWSAEYLHQLQPRRKWAAPQPSVRVGELVLIRSEVTPPTKWPLGRIVDIHPGTDGHTRVATIKTATSEVKRPIAKLICLGRTAD